MSGYVSDAIINELAAEMQVNFQFNLTSTSSVRDCAAVARDRLADHGLPTRRSLCNLVGERARSMFHRELEARHLRREREKLKENGPYNWAPIAHTAKGMGFARDLIMELPIEAQKRCLSGYLEDTGLTVDEALDAWMDNVHDGGFEVMSDVLISALEETCGS